MEDVQSGRARKNMLAPDQSMVLYGFALHGNSEDRMELIMDGPTGEVFRHEARLEQDQAQLFRAFGRRAPTTGWETGDYRGTVILRRGETILAVRHADVTVE